jgi:hypothetical protein
MVVTRPSPTDMGSFIPASPLPGWNPKVNETLVQGLTLLAMKILGGNTQAIQDKLVTPEECSMRGLCFEAASASG